MSRVINSETAGKQRNRLARSVVLAIRELGKQTEPNAESKDMTAFIILALAEMHSTIEETVTAWEKRGYWVKADRFRLDWEWTQQFSKKLHSALDSEDWATIVQVLAQVAQKLNKEKIPERHRLGRPWVGAWKQLNAK